MSETTHASCGLLLEAWHEHVSVLDAMWLLLEIASSLRPGSEVSLPGAVLRGFHDDLSDHFGDFERYPSQSHLQELWRQPALIPIFEEHRSTASMKHGSFHLAAEDLIHTFSDRFDRWEWTFCSMPDDQDPDSCRLELNELGTIVSALGTAEDLAAIIDGLSWEFQKAVSYIEMPRSVAQVTLQMLETLPEVFASVTEQSREVLDSISRFAEALRSGCQDRKPSLSCDPTIEQYQLRISLAERILWGKFQMRAAAAVLDAALSKGILRALQMPAGMDAALHRVEEILPIPHWNSVALTCHDHTRQAIRMFLQVLPYMLAETKVENPFVGDKCKIKRMSSRDCRKMAEGIISNLQLLGLGKYNRSVVQSFLDQESSRAIAALLPSAWQPPQTMDKSPSPKCVVVLGKSVADPPTVSGRLKKPLSIPQLQVIQALLKVGPRRLMSKELEQVNGDARKILSRLARSDDDWKAAILLPGPQKHIGYGLKYQ